MFNVPRIPGWNAGSAKRHWISLVQNEAALWYYKQSKEAAKKSEKTK